MKIIITSLLKIIIIFVLSSNTYAWEEVPIPDHINQKNKSPWNFYEDFQNQNEGVLKLNQLSINDKGSGLKPFKIIKDLDGNKFLEVTVKHGWNNDPKKKKGKETERAELETKPKRTLDKEMWIGFRMRLPEDFTHINDRVLFFQFKNQFKDMKKSPLLGIRYNESGNILDLGGDTGGIATKSWSEEESKKHGIRIKYKKNTKQLVKNWSVVSEKNREQLRKSDNFTLTQFSSFPIDKIGEWVTYKVGIYNTKTDDGFVKVYRDNRLIFNYSGTTFDWKGNYTGSYVRIGIYRNSGKRVGLKYPDQTIHFDDFTILSDKKILDQLLD